MTRTFIRAAAALTLAVGALGLGAQPGWAEKSQLTPKQQQELKDYAHDLCTQGGGTWQETESTYSCSESDGDWAVGITCVTNTGDCDTWESPPSAAGQRRGTVLHLASILPLLTARRIVLVRAAPVIAPIVGPARR